MRCWLIRFVVVVVLHFVLSSIIGFLRAAWLTCMVFCPAFFSRGFLLGLPFTLLSTACGPSRILSPYYIVSPLPCTLSHGFFSGTGYGFSSRLTPFLLREKRFVVKLCVLRIFMRYPSLFFPYTQLAVRKEAYWVF